MSFFGMGPMEILLVLVIAFVFLGPERMVDAARLLGKAVREGRRLASELPQVVIEDDNIKIVNQNDSPSPSQAKSGPSEDEIHASGDPDASVNADGPVSFKAGDQAPTTRDASAEREPQ